MNLNAASEQCQRREQVAAVFACECAVPLLARQRKNVPHCNGACIEGLRTAMYGTRPCKVPWKSPSPVDFFIGLLCRNGVSLIMPFFFSCLANKSRLQCSTPSQSWCGAKACLDGEVSAPRHL